MDQRESGGDSEECAKLVTASSMVQISFLEIMSVVNHLVLKKEIEGFYQLSRDNFKKKAVFKCLFHKRMRPRQLRFFEREALEKIFLKLMSSR